MIWKFKEIRLNCCPCPRRCRLSGWHAIRPTHIFIVFLSNYCSLCVGCGVTFIQCQKLSFLIPLFLNPDSPLFYIFAWNWILENKCLVTQQSCSRFSKMEWQKVLQEPETVLSLDRVTLQDVPLELQEKNGHGLPPSPLGAKPFLLPRILLFLLQCKAYPGFQHLCSSDWSQCCLARWNMAKHPFEGL